MKPVCRCGLVDAHTHWVPAEIPAYLGQRKGVPWPSMAPADSACDRHVTSEGRIYRTVPSSCWEGPRRVEEMAAMGVAHQVVSPMPELLSYWLPLDDAAAMCRHLNEFIAGLVASAPASFSGLGVVPLQDVDAACAELDRCLEAGHRGVEIGNHVGDRDLDDPGTVEFLQHCAARGAPVFVHPWDMPISPRLDRWMAQWIVGMPAETHLSIIAMILGGVFDRVSDDLRICFAHGGGSFAFWLGRFENAWHMRHDIIGTSEQPPSAYLHRFSVDSVVLDERALRLLVDTMGAERVIMGSDYPYPIGERPAGRVVRDADFLSERDRSLILGGNAERFLALSPATEASP